MKQLMYASLIMACSYSHAQAEIDPSSSSYQFSMEPFHAVYDQMGSQIRVNTHLSTDSTSYQIVMSMPTLANQARITTDVIGLSASDGTFAYRDFHLSAPTWAYNRAVYKDGKVMVESFAEDGKTSKEALSPKPVFDGTFAYWQLAGVDNAVTSFVMNRWKYSPAGLVVGMSTVPFERVGKEELTVGGTAYKCQIYEVAAGPEAKLICYVADEAPYLIRQTYQQGDTEPMPIMTLQEVILSE